MTSRTSPIRDCNAGDLNRLLKLESAPHAQGEDGCVTSLSDLVEGVSRRDDTFGRVVVAERGEEILGYANIIPEFQIGRAVLQWRTAAAGSVRGIAGKLIDAAVSRILAAGIKRIHANIWQGSPAAGRLLSERGFRRIRQYLELRLDLAKTRIRETKDDGFPLRFFEPGQEEALTRLQNRSFAGAWGYNPNTVDETILRTRTPGSSNKDIIMAFESDGRAVGYCWSRTLPAPDKGANQRMGRIHMMGVDPDYRGRGLGRQLLEAGLSELAAKGVPIVELTVDRENQSAYALYRSLGFRVWKRSLWYEKKVE